MKVFLKSLLAFMLLFSVLACENEDNFPPGGDAPNSLGKCYVLNSGDWKSNNSSLTMYDGASGETVQNYFELQNGRKLGNTANDIILYGSKMYIAVAGESVIEVVDTDARSLKQIECGAQPRYLAAYGGKVYATYYNGYVAQIDTATLNVEAKVAVGRNPEQLAVCGDRLYVANSGGMDYNTELGYDKSISVVDLSTFSEILKIEVVINPSQVVLCDGEIYVVSYGNYADIPGALQLLSPDGTVDVVRNCPNITEVCSSQGTLYGFLSQYDANWNPTITYLSYTPSTGAIDTLWIKEEFQPMPYKVSATGEYVCVTESDYVNDGDAYVYDADGMLVAKIPSGLNPVKVISVE